MNKFSRFESLCDGFFSRNDFFGRRFLHFAGMIFSVDGFSTEMIFSADAFLKLNALLYDGQTYFTLVHTMNEHQKINKPSFGRIGVIIGHP